MEMANSQVPVETSETMVVDEVLDEVRAMRGSDQIGVVNVAIELLDAHISPRPVDTDRLKQISRAHPVSIADQEPILRAIETLPSPSCRRRLREAFEALKREIALAVPIPMC